MALQFMLCQQLLNMHVGQLCLCVSSCWWCRRFLSYVSVPHSHHWRSATSVWMPRVTPAILLRAYLFCCTRHLWNQPPSLSQIDMPVCDTPSLLLVIPLCFFNVLYEKLCVPVLRYWKRLDDDVPVILNLQRNCCCDERMQSPYYIVIHSKYSIYDRAVEYR